MKKKEFAKAMKLIKDFPEKRGRAIERSMDRMGAEIFRNAFNGAGVDKKFMAKKIYWK